MVPVIDLGTKSPAGCAAPAYGRGGPGHRPKPGRCRPATAPAAGSPDPGRSRNRRSAANWRRRSQHRLHVNVVGQQIVAAMGLAVAESRKNSAGSLPIKRPCISAKATKTVSMAPSATLRAGCPAHRGRRGCEGLAVAEEGAPSGRSPPRPAPRSLYQRRHFAAHRPTRLFAPSIVKMLDIRGRRPQPLPRWRPWAPVGSSVVS